MKKYRKYQERIRTIDRKRTERFYSLWNNKHAEGRVEDFVDRIELSRAPRGRGFRYGTPLRGAHTRRVKKTDARKSHLPQCKQVQLRVNRLSIHGELRNSFWSKLLRSAFLKANTLSAALLLAILAASPPAHHLAAAPRCLLARLCSPPPPPPSSPPSCACSRLLLASPRRAERTRAERPREGRATEGRATEGRATELPERPRAERPHERPRAERPRVERPRAERPWVRRLRGQRLWLQRPRAQRP